MDTKERFISKLTSARFIMTLLFSVTYCAIVLIGCHAYMTALKANPERIEAFATGLLTGFSGVVVLIIKSYFDRDDRGGEK